VRLQAFLDFIEGVLEGGSRSGTPARGHALKRHITTICRLLGLWHAALIKPRTGTTFGM